MYGEDNSTREERLNHFLFCFVAFVLVCNVYFHNNSFSNEQFRNCKILILRLVALFSFQIFQQMQHNRFSLQQHLPPPSSCKKKKIFIGIADIHLMLKVGWVGREGEGETVIYQMHKIRCLQEGSKEI